MTIKNGDLPAMPLWCTNSDQQLYGLTKRESMLCHLLPEVLQSIVRLSESGIQVSVGQERDLVVGAIQLVDIALEELERTK